MDSGALNPSSSSAMHSPMAGSGVRCAQCAYVRMHTRQSKDTPPLASSARADPHAPATAAPFPDFLSPKYRGYALRDAWLSVGVCVGVRLRIRLRLKPRLILLGL